MNLARGRRDYVLEGPVSGPAAAGEAEMRILTAAIFVTVALVFPAWAEQPDAQSSARPTARCPHNNGLRVAPWR